MKTKKKTKFSKVLAFCLAMVLALSMSVTAFAAISSSSTADFTVTGFDTDKEVEVSAYKIIDVNVDDASGQPLNPMYTWTDEVAGWVSTNYSAYVDTNLGANAVADAFETVPADDLTKFLEEMSAAIKAGTITITPATVTSANGNDSATFTGMEMGEYLLTAKGGVKIYQPTTVQVVPVYNEETQDWEIGNPVIGTESTMKSSAPGITKDVTEEDDNTVAIGDTVGYTLTVTVPSYPVNATNTRFEVGDTLGAGLTFDGNGTIKVYSDAALQNEISAANYEITNPGQTTPGEATFLVTFKDDFTTAYTGTTLYVTYTATVNENAFGEDALGNDAFLGYDNDPYTDSDYETTTEKDVYTYGINLTKVDKEGNSLTGAEFTLIKEGEQTAMKFNGSNGAYTYDSQNGGTVEALEVAADGTLAIQGLDVGTYILKETKAPSDYVLPNGQITIVIADADPDGVIDGTAGNIVTANGTIKLYVDEDNNRVPTITDNVISFEVENTSSDDAGFQLPVTGGAGTMLFTVCGILLMGGAVAMVVVLARKKRA